MGITSPCIMNRLSRPPGPCPGAQPRPGRFPLRSPGAHGQTRTEGSRAAFIPEETEWLRNPSAESHFGSIPASSRAGGASQPVQIHVESSLLQRGVLRAPGGSGKGKGIWPDGSHCRAGI